MVVEHDVCSHDLGQAGHGNRTLDATLHEQTKRGDLHRRLAHRGPGQHRHRSRHDGPLDRGDDHRNRDRLGQAPAADNQRDGDHDQHEAGSSQPAAKWAPSR